MEVRVCVTLRVTKISEDIRAVSKIKVNPRKEQVKLHVPDTV